MASTQTFNLKPYKMSFSGETEEKVIQALNTYISETPRIREWYPSSELRSVSMLGVRKEWYIVEVVFVRYSDVVRNADGTAGLSE